MSLPLDMRPARRIGCFSWRGLGWLISTVAAVSLACGGSQLTYSPEATTPPCVLFMPMATDAAVNAQATPFPDEAWQTQAKSAIAVNVVSVDIYNDQGESFDSCTGTLVRHDGAVFLTTSLHCFTDEKHREHLWTAPSLLNGQLVENGTTVGLGDICYQVVSGGQVRLQPAGGLASGPGEYGTPRTNQGVDLVSLPLYSESDSSLSGFDLVIAPQERTEALAAGFPQRILELQSEDKCLVLSNDSFIWTNPGYIQAEGDSWIFTRSFAPGMSGGPILISDGADGAAVAAWNTYVWSWRDGNANWQFKFFVEPVTPELIEQLFTLK